SNTISMLEAINTVMQGKRYFSEDIKDYVFRLMLDDTQFNDDPALEKLSEREIHILRMLVDGRRNKDIASLLFISTKTVETHRNNILKKLGINSTADLVKFAIAKGLTSNPFSS
ncbi:MAG: response regulator transcription factor, partial [Bacteroidota bacterium]